MNTQSKKAENGESQADTQDAASTGQPKSDASPRREIKGGIPYTTSVGVLKSALQGIIQAERPDNFNGHFMSSILDLSGGSARAIPPLLKKMGFLTGDGAPTERYSEFKTDSGRSQAALEGLREAFPELYKKSEYAHVDREDKVKDLIVSITALNKTDKIVGYMYGTFDAIRSFIREGQQAPKFPDSSAGESVAASRGPAIGPHSLGLHYNINVVIPKTSDPKVLSAIFRAIRENLLS